MGAYRNGIQLMFGTVAASVSLHTAIGKDESFHTVCQGTPDAPHTITLVKKPTVCPECDKDVTVGALEPREYAKARKTPEGYAVVEQVEINQVKAPTDAKELLLKKLQKTRISLTAHPVDEVRAQTLQGDSTYFLTPTAGTELLYGFIVDTVRRHPEYALLGLWTPVSRAGLYEVNLFGDTLVMQGRARTEDVLVEQVPVAELEKAHQDMMDMILPALVKTYDPAVYIDTYKAALDALVASKSASDVAGGTTPRAAAASPGVDLMAQLQAQLAALQAATA